jgi:prevent-host-death family protein
MRTVNIHEAKTNLSRLVDQALAGETFVIAKAGKPLVKVMALDAPVAGQIRRLGFLCGEVSVPSDFDRMGSKDIERLFGGGAFRLRAAWPGGRPGP